MVYHSNNHFKNYSLIQGLQIEKLYADYGKKLNYIYSCNFKKLYINYFKKNYKIYKNYINKLYDLKNTDIDYKVRNNILVKVQNFLKRNNNNNSKYSETNLSNAVTNYFRNKYI
jgi:hypothetical protein